MKLKEQIKKPAGTYELCASGESAVDSEVKN
jgi:hypothetical protein